MVRGLPRGYLSGRQRGGYFFLLAAWLAALILFRVRCFLNSSWDLAMAPAADIQFEVVQPEASASTQPMIAAFENILNIRSLSCGLGCVGWRAVARRQRSEMAILPNSAYGFV